MNRLLQLAAALLLTTTLAHAQLQPINSQPQPKSGKKEKPQRSDIEWLWQYTPDDVNKDGRENELVQDPRFVPFLEQFLTAPQTFWGYPINGRYRSLPNTALDHLTVPGPIFTTENRYIAITGCTVHFCPARGLLWVDLNGRQQHLVVFAALDWIKQSRPTTDPVAEYTLWLFPSEPLSVAAGPGSHPPPALMKDIARWTAMPLPGSGIVQNITHAVLVDPDGTPHEVAPAALGVQPVMITVPTGAPTAPGSNTSAPPANDNTGPILKPRN